jgi:hypothetical protein
MMHAAACLYVINIRMNIGFSNFNDQKVRKYSYIVIVKKRHFGATIRWVHGFGLLFEM